MIKVDILKSGTIANSAEFKTQAEVDAWITLQSAQGSFGKIERWVEEKDVLAGKEDISAQLEKRTVAVLGGQSVIQYRFASEFTVQQSDVTVQLQQESDLSSRKQIREKCLDVLDYIAAYNLKQTGSLTSIFSNAQFTPVILALLTGAPKTAADQITLIGPSVAYPQPVIDKVVGMLKTIAGV